MSWSGRQAFLDRWLPQFHDLELAQAQADKYVREAYAPDDARGDAWMTRALLRDQDLAAISSNPENLTIGPSGFELNGCFHCAGRKFVRQDVDVTHVDFGHISPCPACRGQNGDRSSHCPKCADFSTGTADTLERNRCSKCGAYEDQPAADPCGNPGWHLPNARGLGSFDPDVRRDYVGELARHLTGRDM